MSNESPAVRGRDGVRLDRLFEAFGDRRRRRVVRLLAGSSTPVAFEELAEAVAADEGDAAGTGVDDVATAFHHRHLPKLAESGLVSYDGPEGGVEYAATDRVDEAVTALLDFESRFD